MARSIRKTPIFGFTTADSEKADKKRWNRVFNAVTVWDGNKDGKRYLKSHSAKDMRK